MTELSFLLDLLLNHKLPKLTKEAIVERAKKVTEEYELQRSMSQPVNHKTQINPAQIPPQLRGQSPSTIAAMMKHPDLIAEMGKTKTEPVVPIAQPEVQPVEVIAQNAVTQAALAARNAMIAGAISGKPEPGATSPRKLHQ